ncbi:MAG: sulfotransferase [Myxococcota bacterium]|nr:sulfotransferase [Myxococcota bacterium]
MAETSTGLQLESLLDEARERAGGLSDFGEGPFLDPLERFLSSLESEAKLNPIGLIIAKERILGHTVNRLHYVEDRKRFPEIPQQKITKPVFIIGMPRTGTTILHDILARDPANRAPMTWEVMFPSPPPKKADFESDSRIEACAATFPDIDAMIPGFKAMHPMGALLTQECVTMMGETMCTPLFHCQFRVPSYQDWVDQEADWSHVYDFHEKQLQHLQSQHQGDRWVLKTGAHMWGLEHLLSHYPDARIVFTHRDPVESMTSYASLTSLVRTMGSDHVDRREIASDWTLRLRKALEHGFTVRENGSFPDARFYDMHFADFVGDQFSEVAKIYDAFDIPMTPEGRTQMKQFIEDNPKGKHGAHRYTPEEFGVDPSAVRAEFRPYIERFGLEPD